MPRPCSPQRAPTQERACWQHGPKEQLVPGPWGRSKVEDLPVGVLPTVWVHPWVILGSPKQTAQSSMSSEGRRVTVRLGTACRPFPRAPAQLEAQGSPVFSSGFSDSSGMCVGAKEVKAPSSQMAEPLSWNIAGPWVFLLPSRCPARPCCAPARSSSAVLVCVCPPFC